MVELLVRKQYVNIPNGPSLVPAIVPANPGHLEQLDKYVRIGTGVGRAELTYPRDLRRHNWYWSLVSAVADGCGLSPTSLHKNLKHKAGFIESIMLSDAGVPIVELESEKFTRMHEPRAEELRQLAVEILFRDYLPGVRRADVYRHVEKLTGERCPW